MNESEMKASQIIKVSCCGSLLDIPKCELLKKVETIEAENTLLKNQLNNAIAKIQELTKNKTK